MNAIQLFNSLGYERKGDDKYIVLRHAIFKKRIIIDTEIDLVTIEDNITDPPYKDLDANELTALCMLAQELGMIKEFK